MTEIPEHLLKRSRERRRATNGEPDGARDSLRAETGIDGGEPYETERIDVTEEPEEQRSFPWKAILVVLGAYALPWVILAAFFLPRVPFSIDSSFKKTRAAARNFGPNNAGFWWILILSSVIVMIAMIIARSTDYQDDPYYRRFGSGRSRVRNRAKHYTPGVASFIVASALIAGSFGGFLNSWWNNKEVPQYYNTATQFVVVDPNIKPSNTSPIAGIYDGIKPGTNGCAFVGKHDVPSCVVQGTFPTEGFEERSMAYTGAMLFMSQNAPRASNTDLLTDTGTYISTGNGAGYWSAIVDGKNLRTPAYGVSTWDPLTERLTKSCEFKGKYELNKALRGSRQNSLLNMVREKFSPNYPTLQDIYGVCVDHGNGDVEPVLYMPLIVERRTDHRTVVAPGVLVEMHGSPSGAPLFIPHHTVSPEDHIPGPVYPLSIAIKQREEHVWSAGRQYFNKDGFGFEPTTAKEQDGNATDFLLRAKWNGRDYWVSQMTSRNAGSQNIAAYFLIPADEFQSGKLNTLQIFVLADDDPRSVNIEFFVNQAKQALSKSQPGFFNANGKVTEFTPGLNGEWVAYGIFEGLPSFRVRIDPSTFELSFEDYTLKTEGGVDAESIKICGEKPIADLTKDEATKCAKALIDQVASGGS